MITVIGVDGRPLTEPARRALADAPVVVGGRRNLALVGVAGVELGPLSVLDDLPDGAVVLASGDPGYFGVVRALRERGYQLQVVPATSSVARAFARVGLPWDGALVVSAHGRSLARAANVCRARRAVAVLTGPGSGPAELGAALRGYDRELVVVEDLDGDEALTRVPPEQAADRAWREPNVVLCLGPQTCEQRWLAAEERQPWALPETDFEHRDSMITKAEVRAWVLARLAPGLGGMVWDIGAGSGSVAIECVRLGAAAIAIEQDAATRDVIARNAKAHDVDVRVAADLSGLPAPDAVFVGGGGIAMVQAAVAAAPDRIVVALAAIERVGPVLDLLAGYRTEASMLQASRLIALPDGSHRLAAQNPVVVVSGVATSASRS